MEMQHEMPKAGQFVAVLFINGCPFAATLKWEEMELMCYDDANDIWLNECDHGYSEEFLLGQRATFILELPF